jgi:hypothetical protein
MSHVVARPGSRRAHDRRFQNKEEQGLAAVAQLISEANDGERSCSHIAKRLRETNVLRLLSLLCLGGAASSRLMLVRSGSLSVLRSIATGVGESVVVLYVLTIDAQVSTWPKSGQASLRHSHRSVGAASARVAGWPQVGQTGDGVLKERQA